MKHEELTHQIISCAYQVYNKLGFGFLESVYKKAMVVELNKNNLKAEQEKPLKVYYDNQIVGDFYVDLLVENEIIARPPRLSLRWRAGGTQISPEPGQRTCLPR